MCATKLHAESLLSTQCVIEVQSSYSPVATGRVSSTALPSTSSGAYVPSPVGARDTLFPASGQLWLCAFQPTAKTALYDLVT